MRLNKWINTVDSHTAGMPTRMVVGGFRTYTQCRCIHPGEDLHDAYGESSGCAGQGAEDGQQDKAGSIFSPRRNAPYPFSMRHQNQYNHGKGVEIS